MFKSVLLKTLRDFVKPFFYFFIGIFLISLLVMYVIAEIPLVEFEAILGDLPKIITAIVGGHSVLDLTSVEGVLNTDVFSIIAPVIVIGLGLSLPIGRKRFLIEKMISLIIKVFLVGFIFWFSFILSAFIFDLSLSYYNLAIICLNLSFLGIIFGLFSVFLGTITSNSNVIFSVSSIFAIISYIVFTLAPLFSKISFTKYFSLFYYYKGGDPLVNGLHHWHWMISILLIFSFFIISLYKWDLKELS